MCASCSRDWDGLIVPASLISSGGAASVVALPALSLFMTGMAVVAVSASLSIVGTAEPSVSLLSTGKVPLEVDGRGATLASGMLVLPWDVDGRGPNLTFRSACSDILVSSLTKDCPHQALNVVSDCGACNAEDCLPSVFPDVLR